MTTADQVRRYCEERDAAVLAGVDAVIAFAAEQGFTFSSREAAELTMHKMRTAIGSLPMDVRVASWEWLKARGHRTLDDGDLGKVPK